MLASKQSSKMEHVWFCASFGAKSRQDIRSSLGSLLFKKKKKLKIEYFSNPVFCVDIVFCLRLAVTFREIYP